MKQILENTLAPFGIKELNNNYYLYCLLSNNNDDHMKIKEKINNLEKKIYLQNNSDYKFKSNIYKYNDDYLLKLRIKKIKKHLKYDVEYKNDEKYLKTIHNISKNDNITIIFYNGQIYKVKYKENNIISIPLFISKIIFE